MIFLFEDSLLFQFICAWMVIHSTWAAAVNVQPLEPSTKITTENLSRQARDSSYYRDRPAGRCITCAYAYDRGGDRYNDRDRDRYNKNVSPSKSKLEKLVCLTGIIITSITIIIDLVLTVDMVNQAEGDTKTETGIIKIYMMIAIGIVATTGILATTAILAIMTIGLRFIQIVRQFFY